MQSTRYSWQILIKLQFSGQILENNQILNLMKFVHVRDELIVQTDGRTDRHKKSNSRFTQFCESA